MRNKNILIILIVLLSINLKAQKMNITADSTARCYASAEILIEAPKSTVFGLLAQINEWPEWQSSVLSSHLDGTAEEGKKFKWKAGGLNIKSKLHTVHPNSEIGWTGKIWWIKAVHNWTLTEENGQTKVVVKEALKGLGSSMMKKSLQEGMLKNLAELKSRAEKN